MTIIFLWSFIKETWWQFGLPFLFLIGFFFLIVLTVLGDEERWMVLAEGSLKKIEHCSERHSRRSGAMVHTTHYYTVWFSTLYFEGGTVIYNVRGKLEAPGTAPVRLMKSNLGNYRLDPYTSVKT